MIGDRIREERLRLGLKQPELGDIADVASRTVIDWEKGVSSPTAVQLAALAGAGLDALYVVTGQRSQVVAPQELLNTGDRVLLDNFHAAPAQVQAGIKTTLGAFSPSTTRLVRGRASTNQAAAAAQPVTQVNTGAGAVQIGSAGGDVTVHRPPTPARKRRA